MRMPPVTSQFTHLLCYKPDEPNRAVPVSRGKKKKSLPALDESRVGPTGDLYSGISYLPLDVADLYSILTSTMRIGGSWLSSHPI